MYQCLRCRKRSAVCSKLTLFLAADDFALLWFLPDGEDIGLTMAELSVRSRLTKRHFRDQKTRGVPLTNLVSLPAAVASAGGMGSGCCCDPLLPFRANSVVDAILGTACAGTTKPFQRNSKRGRPLGTVREHRRYSLSGSVIAPWECSCVDERSRGCLAIVPRGAARKIGFDARTEVECCRELGMVGHAVWRKFDKTGGCSARKRECHEALSPESSATKETKNESLW